MTRSAVPDDASGDETESESSSRKVDPWVVVQTIIGLLILGATIWLGLKA